MGRVGTGGSIAFGTSSWAGDIVGIRHGGISREDIEDSHLGTTPARTFLPGALYDAGEVELDVAYDPDDPPPFSGAPETITITFPTVTGESNGATHEFTGYINDHGYEIPFEDLVKCSVKIKVSGAITQANSS